MSTDENGNNLTGDIGRVTDGTVVTPDLEISSPRTTDVEQVTRESGYGSLNSAITRAYRGINYRGFGSPVPMNKDQYGLTFFTRPRLNLSYDNISQLRTMVPMLDNKEISVPGAIRKWLDRSAPDSPLVDNKNPFITLLTNNLISISGWPDPTLDTYTAKAGIRKEEWSMVDGVYRVLNTFDITATFKNIATDPITLLFHTWCQYMAAVYDGTMMPHESSIIDNEIDYQTRIYRLTLDPARERVQKIAACGAAFPTSSAIGTHFDFTNETPFNTDADQISIPFRCVGMDYLDPISISDFNRVVEMFNIQMQPEDRSTMMVKLSRNEKRLFNTDTAYPRINPETHDLELWVTSSDYQRLSNEFA